jgi:hypothetical protein
MSKSDVIGSKGNEAKREFSSAENWHGAKLETPRSDNLLTDPGFGDARIIRRFEFSLPPMRKGEAIPTNEQLKNFHRPKIVTFLWKDGLDLISDLGIVRKKNKFYIEVLCEVQKSVTGRGTKHNLYENPLTLKQVIHGN